MHTSDQNPPQSCSKPQSVQPDTYIKKQPVRHKGAMGEFVAHQKRRSEIDELDRLIGTLNRSINASSYELLVLIREFDERAGWLAWSFTDGVSWLRWRCDLGVGAAREKLRIAHALKELPVISREFSAGNLSYSKVRVLTRVATRENEEGLVELARKLTVRHLTEHCKQRSNAQAESTSLAKAAQSSRNYRVWHDDHRGTVHISIEVPAEEGALIEQAVEKAAVQQSVESGARFVAVDQEPSWGAVQADAVVSVMRRFLSVDGVEPGESSGGFKAQSTADHYQVVVHVDEAALVSSTTPSTQSAPTSQYPIETVRRLCCDGSIIPIIENAKGEPLNVGRKVRTITTAIRRALWSRDKGCAFPGCGHTRFVDAHHIRHWAEGGETRVENLVLLCSNHHTMVHEGGYSIGRDQSGDLFFKRPDGVAVPHCGYFRDDWIDADVAVGDCGKTREFFDGFTSVDEFTSDKSIENETDEINEPSAEYIFPVDEVVH